MSCRATLWRDVKKDFGRLAASPKMNSAEDHWACLCWVRADQDPAVPEQQTNPLKWINQKHRSFLLSSPVLDPLSFSQSQTLSFHFILAHCFLVSDSCMAELSLNVEACSWALRIIPQPCLCGPIPSPTPFPLKDFMDYYLSVNIEGFSKDPKKQPIRYSPIIQENINLNKYSLNQSLSICTHKHMYVCAQTQTHKCITSEGSAVTKIIEKSFIIWNAWRDLWNKIVFVFTTF